MELSLQSYISLMQNCNMATMRSISDVWWRL